MRIYKKGELRDIIIAFLVLGTVLSIATIYKDKEAKNTPEKRTNVEKLMAIKSQGRVLE